MVTAAPDVSPILSREKNYPPVSAPRKSGNPLIAVAAVVIFVILALGLWRATHQAPAAEKVMVVAAGRDIPAGVRLGFTSLHLTEIPKAYLTPDMVTASNQVVGRVTRTYVPKGEPVLTSMLFSGRDGLSLNIESDERAITLDLGDDALVDHSVCPGDRVDLLVTSTKDGKKYTKTICQAVRVLISVPKEALLSQNGRRPEQNRITLAVLPELSEKIAEASDVGKIRLVLRNRLSRRQQNLPGADPRDLLPAQALTETLPAVPRPLPPPTAAILPPPPPVIAAAELTPQPAQQAKGPLEWIVEVVSGNHKDKYAVPQR